MMTQTVCLASRAIWLPFLCVFLICPALHAQKGGATKLLDQLISNATIHGDERAARRLSNLKQGLARLTPADLRGVRCGRELPGRTVSSSDADTEVSGRLLDKALERYLPALAAALSSASATGLFLVFTPEVVGSDAVEILNSSDKRDAAEVRNAARQFLQDTKPKYIRSVPTPLLAKAVACLP
jgi:hypothetical protein